MSRASDFTALVALNFFFFFRPGILLLVGPRTVLAQADQAELIRVSFGPRHYAIIASDDCLEESLEEREMFDEKEQKRPHTLLCPHCRQSGEYELSWLVRTKKRQLPPRADERDRAKFAKARSYMVRKDDLVACKNLRCRKRFEVAGVQSVAFLE